MKTKIIYIAPNDKVFTYNVTSYEIVGNVVLFVDEVNNETIRLPLDRCQIREVA
jgi:hypothetical protein